MHGRQGVCQVIAAALDVGGTHVTSGRVDVATGRVMDVERRAWQPAAERGTLLATLQAAARAASRGVSCAGVAVPGPFDYERGLCTIRGVGKLDAIHGVSLRRALAPEFGLAETAVRFLNDAEAFALGELEAGAARGHPRVLAITLGTGLGSAFLVNGEVIRSGPGVPPGGAVHLLTLRGRPVEEALSRRALLRQYGDDGVDVADVARRALNGDQLARTCFRAFSDDLREFLDDVAASFHPSCIVLGGSIARSWELVDPSTNGRLGSCVVRPAMLGESASMLGAARHAALR